MKFIELNRVEIDWSSETPGVNKCLINVEEIVAVFDMESGALVILKSRPNGIQVIERLSAIKKKVNG